MKRATFVTTMSLVGSVIGLITSLMFTAFITECGEDCSSERLENYVLCFIAGFVVFSIASIFFSRRSMPSLRQALLGIAVVSSLFLAPAFIHYVFDLRSEYLKFKAMAPVQPTGDFFHMAITTRAVKGYSDASYEMVRPLADIPQWSRCVIGATQCESSPRQVQILCKSGVMYINEQDWPAFVLIPAENSQGVAPLKSMQLCKEE